jgi:hypothetical protein
LITGSSESEILRIPNEGSLGEEASHGFIATIRGIIVDDNDVQISAGGAFRDGSQTIEQEGPGVIADYGYSHPVFAACHPASALLIAQGLAYIRRFRLLAEFSLGVVLRATGNQDAGHQDVR